VCRSGVIVIVVGNGIIHFSVSRSGIRGGSVSSSGSGIDSGGGYGRGGGGSVMIHGVGFDDDRLPVFRNEYS
jgi:hypothetical protein